VNRDYCTFWANFPVMEPPWIRRGGAGVKIKDCLENGAGPCRNEELIEELLAMCGQAGIFLDALEDVGGWDWVDVNEPALAARWRDLRVSILTAIAAAEEGA